jgi:hypothetical protein
MTTVLTRADAAAALAARVAERDKIQANLLDLDASFGKRLLAGATLTGETKLRWDAASADLAWLWRAFTEYSAVVQQVADILDRARHPGPGLLVELTALLTGPSVVLASELVPPTQRQLTESSQPEERVTLALAVEQMTTAFSRVAGLLAAVEAVWNEVSDRLDRAASALGPARLQAAGPAEDDLSDALDSVDTELTSMRGLLTSDPLWLWHDDMVDTSGADQLLLRARDAATRAAEIDRLRADADHRIAEVARKVAVAQACEQDGCTALDEAMQKIAAPELPARPSGTAGLSNRLAGLDVVKVAGRWTRLAADLAAIDDESAATAREWQAAARTARELVEQRNELRGLLDAYRAKAGRLGGAENSDLAETYQLAHDVLWSAPCDLAEAADAVHRYQQAVLALQVRTS